MKKWIISLNLLYYITFFHRFNGAESQPASLSTGQSTSGTAAVDSGSTNPPVTTTITPITLNINKSSSTNQFNYLKNGDFRTYTPKSGHVFSKIVKKALEIWNAKPGDHALKAVLMGSAKNPKHLALLLQSGNFVLLHKSGKGKPWIDITNDKHDVKKLKFLGENDSELTSSNYKVDLVDLLFTYMFNSGVTCKKITYDDNEVWKHTDDPAFASLKSFALDLSRDQFFVKNSSDQSKELTKAKVSVYVNATQSESTHLSGTHGGTEQRTHSSGSGTGTGGSGGGTHSSGSGEKSDYEKFLDQLLEQQSTKQETTPVTSGESENQTKPTTP